MYEKRNWHPKQREREAARHVSSRLTSHFAATLIKKVAVPTNLDSEQTER